MHIGLSLLIGWVFWVAALSGALGLAALSIRILKHNRDGCAT